jgi:hypothetical protein
MLWNSSSNFLSSPICTLSKEVFKSILNLILVHLFPSLTITLFHPKMSTPRICTKKRCGKDSKSLQKMTQSFYFSIINPLDPIKEVTICTKLPFQQILILILQDKVNNFLWCFFRSHQIHPMVI